MSRETAMSANDGKTPMEQAVANWQLYYMLTQELLKFINKQDIDGFLELVRQRTVIFDRLQAMSDKSYQQTREYHELVEKIKPMDMQIIYKAKT